MINCQTVYIAKPEFIAELCGELAESPLIIDRFVFSNQPKRDVCFALDRWDNPIIVEFNSISEATKILRQAGKYWYLYPFENVRRSKLIEEGLRNCPELTRAFPITENVPEIGCFTLLDKNRLMYSTKRWKRWPMGECHFIEDKTNPPNRAYLKLWEAITLLDRYPASGDIAVDLGASPGGWTYVMQSLGANVISVDKAPLDNKIAALPRVQFMQQSAFALEPSEWQGNIDWLLCDVACYPDRLYEMLTKWIASGKVKQFIFTIKLQGETNLEIIRKFQAIPNSRVVNLFYNKHEATFFYPA